MRRYAALMEEDLISLLARACERLVGTVFSELSGAGFADFGATEALALRLLADGPATARSLAGSLGITPQAAGRISADLERRGLVTRGHDPRDARARPLTLTADGLRAAQVMRTAEQRAVQLWQAASGTADLAATARALRAYLDATAVAPQPAPPRIRFS